MTPVRLRLTGRRWAYIGAALGGTASILANIAHSFVPPQGAVQGWSPMPGAVIAATFWPVALFVTTEILTRVAWPSGGAWQLVKWLGMLPVAVVAALVSYRHLSGLLAHYGEDTIGSVLGPLAVDGLMVIATGAILATNHHQHTTVSAPVSTGPTPITVAAPTLPAVPTPRITAPAPADIPEPPTRPAATPAPVTAARSETVPTPAQVATRVTPSPTSIPLRPTATRPAAAGASKPSPRKTGPTTPATPLAAPATDTPVTAPEPAQLPLPLTVAPDLLVKARQAAAQYRTETGTPIKAGQLAARLRVNSEQAAQALAVLDLDPNTPTTDVPTVNGHRPAKATR